MDQDRFQNTDKFDKTLSDSLRKHREPVRSGFTDKVISGIDKLEEQKLLSKVVLQERLALACSIAWVLSLLFAITFFGKDIAGVLTNSFGVIANSTANTFLSFQPNWKLILVAVVTIASVLYAFSDSLNLNNRFFTKLFD